MEEVPVVESEAIVDVKSGLTRGWSGPLKNAAAQPRAVSLLKGGSDDYDRNEAARDILRSTVPG